MQLFRLQSFTVLKSDPYGTKLEPFTGGFEAFIQSIRFINISFIPNKNYYEPIDWKSKMIKYNVKKKINS